MSWGKGAAAAGGEPAAEPGSEFRVHRHWFVESAMDALLETDFAVAEKNRLYGRLDRIVPPKQELIPSAWTDAHGGVGGIGNGTDSNCVLSKDSRPM